MLVMGDFGLFFVVGLIMLLVLSIRIMLVWLNLELMFFILNICL